LRVAVARERVSASHSFLTNPDLARRGANGADSESFAGDSRDSRSNRRSEVRNFALVQKKFSPRFRVRAARLVTASARAKLRRRSCEKIYDKIVTAEKPLFHRHFCNRLFV